MNRYGIRPLKRSSCDSASSRNQMTKCTRRLGSLTTGERPGEGAGPVLVGVVQEVLLELVEDHQRRAHAASAVQRID